MCVTNSVHYICGTKANNMKQSELFHGATIEQYKGYELHILPIVDNPNGRKTQTVHAVKNGDPIAASYADIELENALEKIKIKVDKIIDGTYKFDGNI